MTPEEKTPQLPDDWKNNGCIKEEGGRINTNKQLKKHGFR